MSIKLNFILNTSRLFLGSFSLLITLPYITRTLGSLNLGKIEYSNSIITYFLLFTALGIPYYGIREISKNKENKKKLTIVTIELITILFCMTLIGYIIFLILLFNIKSFKNNSTLFIIMSLNILFTNLGLEWFYQGIENQIYITIRYIVIKIFTIFALFLFIKNPDDYLKYAFLLVVMNGGSNIFNLIHLRKYINLKEIILKDLSLKRHFKPIFIIFTGSIAKSIYLQLDSVMLGSIKGPEDVAYYAIANKLIRLVLIIVTALGTVMLPRLINCLKNDEINLYKKYSQKSLKYILLLAFPSVIGIYLLADNIILLMAGEGFLSSVEPMKIISIIILIVGLAHYIGHQVLYVNSMEKYYTYTVTLSAIINFLFNYIFIPKYGQNGAAVGTVIAELTGVLIMLYFAKNKLKEVDFYGKENLKYFYASFLMGIIIFFIKKLNISNLEKLMISIILGGATYLIVLLLLKEYFILEGIKIIKLKLKRS